MRHLTLIHEVDLNIIERSRARKAETLAVGEGAQKPSVQFNWLSHLVLKARRWNCKFKVLMQRRRLPRNT